MYQLWCSLRTCFVDESTFEANILFFQRNILIWLSLECLDEGLNVTPIHPSATGSKKIGPLVYILAHLRGNFKKRTYVYLDTCYFSYSHVK